jgi:hypothetical protein
MEPVYISISGILYDVSLLQSRRDLMMAHISAERRPP